MQLLRAIQTEMTKSANKKTKQPEEGSTCVASHVPARGLALTARARRTALRRGILFLCVVACG